jgi:hypothetical protein
MKIILKRKGEIIFEENLIRTILYAILILIASIILVPIFLVGGILLFLLVIMDMVIVLFIIIESIFSWNLSEFYNLWLSYSSHNHLVLAAVGMIVTFLVGIFGWGVLIYFGYKWGKLLFLWLKSWRFLSFAK